MSHCEYFAKLNTFEKGYFLKYFYQNMIVPDAVSAMTKDGYTCDTLCEPEVLYRFIVDLTVERAPLTQIGIVEQFKTKLRQNNLYDLKFIKTKPDLITLIKKIFKELAIADRMLGQGINPDNQIALQNYSRTLAEISANTEEIRDKMYNCTSESNVKDVFNAVDKIYGINKVLAAKFCKYTLRELQIKHVRSNYFKSVAKHLIGEFHVGRWTKELSNFDELYEEVSDDPFAIDVFYHLNKSFCYPIKNCKRCELKKFYDTNR